jgi:hypothetical protein
MKAAMTRTYRQNRDDFPVDELARYDGKWVAFSADARRVVASGETIVELCDRVRANNVDPQDVVIERVEMNPEEVNLGGAELL